MKIFKYSKPIKIFLQKIGKEELKVFLLTKKILERKRDGKYLIANRDDK
jgi:hypothetical protein